MNIFVTGATGYIGGSVAVRLLRDGHRIRGLVRSPGKADRLRQLGIEPVVGALDDADLLIREARRDRSRARRTLLRCDIRPRTASGAASLPR
jgi:uncharacterized protein YbjT (DUF2867 family)